MYIPHRNYTPFCPKTEATKPSEGLEPIKITQIVFNHFRKLNSQETEDITQAAITLRNKFNAALYHESECRYEDL